MSNRIPDETRQAIALDYLAGMKMTKIADKYGVSYGTVSRIVDDTKMGELKEKKSAPAEAETDTKKEVMYNDDLDTFESNTKQPKSQGISGVNIIALMQTMLDQAYGSEVEITSLSATSCDASIKFKHDGVKYSINFEMMF